MQPLNSLYFPETALPHHKRHCLLLLADTLHFLQPIEENGSELEESSEGDLFMERGICQAHTPQPLGKDRERFLALIQEIKSRKDFYAEQLSSLTLAHLSEGKNEGDHDRQAIMASLLGGALPPGGTKEEKDQQEELWQARLVLTLAEILDREEAELAAELSFIDNHELALFQELKGEEEDAAAGEEENPFTELLRIKARMGQPRPGTIKRRFQAWKILYDAGPLPEKFWLWTTVQEEAADLLFSQYEEASNGISVPLLLLDLPQHIYLEDDDALKRIQEFQEEAADLRETISEKLSAIIDQDHLDPVDPVALLPDAGLLAREWNEFVDFHFPAQRFGRQKLDLQLLANVSLDALLRHPAEAGQGDSPGHTILALCRE